MYREEPERTPRRIEDIFEWQSDELDIRTVRDHYIQGKDHAELEIRMVASIYLPLSDNMDWLKKISESQRFVLKECGYEIYRDDGIADALTFGDATYKSDLIHIRWAGKAVEVRDPEGFKGYMEPWEYVADLNKRIFSIFNNVSVRGWKISKKAVMWKPTSPEKTEKPEEMLP